MSVGRVVVAFLSALSFLGGCDDPRVDPPPEHLSPQWRALDLPMPAGEPGRLILREAVACDSTWYILGAVGGSSGETRPAVWTSRDGEVWTAVALRPRTYYGHRAVLYSGACEGDQIAALGAKVGGAHGNPRVTTWRQLPDGSLDEVLAGFELYGGPKAINVARMAAGGPGWMMAGNRYSGAAVWISADSSAFQIREDVAELSSDERGETWAADVVATGDGWVVVGGLLSRGRVDRDPLAWRSADGAAWVRTTGPITRDYDEFQRAAVLDGEVYALGPRGDTFGVWRLNGLEWALSGTFGVLDAGAVASVHSATALDGGLLAAVSDGSGYQLWAAEDASSWIKVKAPIAMRAGAGTGVCVTAVARRAVLLVDDGSAGTAWTADLSVTV